MPERPYIYYDFTLSICSTCLKRVEAKVIFENDLVYLLKRCPDHGAQKVLIATDIDYYKKIRNYVKRSETPLKFNTPVKHGCPYDCGLCTDHEQHSCLSIIEVTDRCNLKCPTCYAMSGPRYGRHRTLEEIEKMMDIIVANEGEPDVVQISGGEPTIHPQFFEILDLAKARPIKHLMVNTNGIRIAKDKDFVKRLATYAPDFEIYLQFDSFRPDVLMRMRGQDLSDIRTQAIAHLNEFDLSTTLVVTLQKGLNDDEMGEIIEYATKQKAVRGITFQPTSIAGRLENFDPSTDRLTLTEVRQNIIDQSNIFEPNDIIPVPCNPDSLAMAYALKVGGEVLPLTRYLDPVSLLENGPNTIVYEQETDVHEQVIKLFSTNQSVEKASEGLHNLLCCIPRIEAPHLGYNNLFRIIIMQFMDSYNFDVRAIKKSCVHIVHKDGRVIPFETMNLFYRDEKESYLEELKLQT